MGARVILNLGEGSCDRGFNTVIAQIWIADSQAPMQALGRLPENPELRNLYHRWQQFYAALYAHRNWRKTQFRNTFKSRDINNFENDFEIEIEEDENFIEDVSEAGFKQLCQQLQRVLNSWLNSESFRPIDRQLRTRLLPTDEVNLIIVASDRQVLQLPWCLWHFLEDYPRTELALSLPEYTASIKSKDPVKKQSVKILAILGNSAGIDVATDQQLLQTLPETQIQFLVEPNLEELNQQLWQPGWDVLFFAGHSTSDRAQTLLNAAQGCIQINPTTAITLDQLRYGLKKAIERGLKLAIFNSCDGLGLAWDLADLHIPQVIVMREPVPDRVAQVFLKHFLAAFSSGQSLYLSVREAREQLQALEAEFLCATWLPIICQNPAELPPLWQDWLKITPPTASPVQPAAPTSAQPQSFPALVSLRRLLLASLVITGLVGGVRWLGGLQPLELWAFDRLMALRPTEPSDERFLLITIDEADIQAQDTQPEATTGPQRRGSLSDAALDRLLKQIMPHQPRVVGLDLYRDFPTQPAFPNVIKQLQTSDRLITICKSRDAIHDPAGVAPPPESPLTRVGFSDFVEDADGILRRHLLAGTPDPVSPCMTDFAFSWQLALRYLQSQGIQAEFTPTGSVYLGSVKLPLLDSRAGGYQGIDAAGYQILLNYRALPSPNAIAPQVSLTQVLTGKVQPDAIRDRIVLIGPIANSVGDFWVTPYGSGTRQRVPGVVLQAQMTSQLLSAVLSDRPLLSVWPGMGEIVWMWGWAMVGGLLAWVPIPSLGKLKVGILGIGALASVTALSLVLISQGVWVPLIPAVFAIAGTGGWVYFGPQHRTRR